MEKMDLMEVSDNKITQFRATTLKYWPFLQSQH